MLALCSRLKNRNLYAFITVLSITHGLLYTEIPHFGLEQNLNFVIMFYTSIKLVFNATFNNISVILWWSVLLVEETRVPRENHL